MAKLGNIGKLAAKQACFSNEPMKIYPTLAVDTSSVGSMACKEDGNTRNLRLQILTKATPAPAIAQGSRPLDQEIHPGSAVQFCGSAATKTYGGGNNVVNRWSRIGVVDRWHVKKQRWIVVMGDGREIVADADQLQVIAPSTMNMPPGLPNAANAGMSARLGRTTHQKQNSYNGSDSTLSSVESILQDEESSSQSSQSDDETDGSKGSEQLAVMLRGLPNNFTRDMLVELLDSQGFHGCYNLVYLPIDIQTEAACGYATVTLFRHSEAKRLLKHFEDFRNWPVVSDKVCRTSWGHLGRLHVHVDRYRNSATQHESVPDKFKPVLFNIFGKRVPFPSPTKMMMPPRFTTPAAKSAKPQTI